VNAISPTITHPTFGIVRATAAFFGRHVVAFNVLGFVAVLAMCATYIVQINGSVSAGYQLRELEVRIDELSLENEKLEISVRKAQSLSGLEKSVRMLGLVPSQSPHYVEAGLPSVALAR